MPLISDSFLQTFAIKSYHNLIMKPQESRGSVFALESCHSFREHPFVGVAILKCGCLPQTARRGSHKSWWVPSGGPI